MGEIRGYRAQQPAEPALIDPPQPAEAVWPQQRWYRARCQADDDCVAVIMARYGLSSKEDAIRAALHMVAGDAVKVTVSAPAAKRVIIKIKRPITS